MPRGGCCLATYVPELSVAGWGGCGCDGVGTWHASAPPILLAMRPGPSCLASWNLCSRIFIKQALFSSENTTKALPSSVALVSLKPSTPQEVPISPSYTSVPQPPNSGSPGGLEAGAQPRLQDFSVGVSERQSLQANPLFPYMCLSGVTVYGMMEIVRIPQLRPLLTSRPLVPQLMGEELWLPEPDSKLHHLHPIRRRPAHPASQGENRPREIQACLRSRFEGSGGSTAVATVPRRWQQVGSQGTHPSR